MIPKALFGLERVILYGPCKAPIEIRIEGTLKGPSAPKQFLGLDNWINFGYMDGFTLSGNGTIDGQGASAWPYNDCSTNSNCKKIPIVRNLNSLSIYVYTILKFYLLLKLIYYLTINKIQSMRFDFISNGHVTGITSLNPKFFHINVLGCKNFVIEHVNTIAPEQSPNTDGIHIGRSNGVIIANTKISTGDDCISIGDGTKNLTIKSVDCGPGHGISIGSLGKFVGEQPVDLIIVQHCNIRKTMNGVRIKSFPSTSVKTNVSNVHFEDIFMEDVSNPILIDQSYCPHNMCSQQVRK